MGCKCQQGQQCATPSTSWNQADAIVLARRVEDICTEHSFHVALTGGCLYKAGPLRKDCDLLFYSLREVLVKDDDIALRKDDLLEVLENELGIKVKDDYGFCVKASYRGKNLDLLFPENHFGAYPKPGEKPPDEPVTL
jgi:hypothetical protein